MDEPDQRADVRPGAVIPLLSVRRGTEAVAFYEAAFGAVVTFRIEDEGATFAQLTIGGAPVWVSDESPEHENFSPETLGGSSIRLILTVDDPEALANRALAAGARSVAAVSEQNGWLSGRVVDPFGHHWEIGKPL